MGVKERRGSCRKTKGPLGQSGSSVAKKGGIKMFRNQETHTYTGSSCQSSAYSGQPGLWLIVLGNGLEPWDGAKVGRVGQVPGRWSGG